MRKKRFFELQIIKVLKQVEDGWTVQEVGRERGVSQATSCNWKSNCCGIVASDIKRLKDLEAENHRPKQIYANLSLENEALKDIIEKKL